MLVDGVDTPPQPDLIVVGPVTAEEGDKIVITAKSELAAVIDFTVIYNGEHSEDVYEVIDCHCVTQSKPGKYIVLVKAIKDNKVNSFTHNILVHPRGNGPDPQPPGPDVDVKPNVPEGFSGLTKWSFEKAKELNLTKNDVSIYSSNLKSATEWAYSDVDALNIKIRESNKLLDSKLKDRLVPLDNAIKNKLIELFKLKTIDDIDSHKKAYKAISEGLNHVK